SVGLLRLREWALEQQWLRRPYVALALLIVALEAAVLAAGNAVPHVGPWVPALLAAVPAFVLVGWLASVQHDPRIGFGLVLALVVAGCWGMEVVEWQRARGPRGDLAFVAEVNRRVPAGEPVLLLDGWGPLDPSWALYYFHGRARLLHNVTFLR